MSKGYIKLHRQITDCWIWFDDDKFSKAQAWIDLLMMANHKDVKLPFNGKIIVIKRGQFITSIRKLAERWKWSKDKTAKFLDLLQSDEMLVRESDTKRTLITIVNYELFQGEDGSERTPNGHQTDTKRTPSGLNNNDKNVNNDKEESIGAKAKRFTPPTLEEVKAYCEERNNGIDPQRFIDYYSANGWVQGKGKPIKDWKACIRTWERYSNKEEPKVSEKAKKRHSKYDDLEKYYLNEV